MSANETPTPTREYRVLTRTFGCKVNQVDTAALMKGLSARGFVEVDRETDADVVVVNACTVTSSANKDARKLVSKAKQLNGDALVVLTGCLSDDDSSGQDKADLVLGNEAKGQIPERIAARLEGREPVLTAKGGGAFFGGGAVDFSSRSRAFIKVQDGCNMPCAYCVIPKVRGKSTSRAIEEILDDVRGVRAQGYNEVVITGVHMGKFGRDMDGRDRLVDLVRAILEETDVPRLRLSSVEPLEMTDALIDLMAGSDRICRHFHIPLQSGDDETLRRMRRPYRTAQYRDRVNAVIAAMPDALIGADVIVGFPGESEEAFLATYEFVRDVPLHHLHVFPFSVRPGTEAATMPDHIPPHVIKARGQRLRELGAQKWNDYVSRFVGRPMRALILRQLEDGRYEGLARNYIPIVADGPFVEGAEYSLTSHAKDGDFMRSRLVACRSRHGLTDTGGILAR